MAGWKVGMKSKLSLKGKQAGFMETEYGASVACIARNPAAGFATVAFVATDQNTILRRAFLCSTRVSGWHRLV